MTAAASGDQNIACVGDSKLSDAVAFTPADLGVAARENDQQIRVLTGPRTRVVVRDSVEWSRAWSRAVDTVPAPLLAFGENAVILVATRTYTVGPTRLEVVALRRCRSSDVLVVAVREVNPHGGGEDHGSRGIQAVRVRRPELTHGTVQFVDLRTPAS